MPPPAVQESQKKPQPERKPGRLPRIMIADDDIELLELMSISLGDKYELFTVCNGLDAIRESETIEPDIFVLDVMMPRITGYQVCQVLKKSEHFANTPVIIISAKASPKDIDYIKKLGVKAFIAKPFTFMQLDNAIVKITKDPYFEMRPKLHTYEEILTMKDQEAVKREEKDKERLHRETKNIMRDFIKQHKEKK